MPTSNEPVKVAPSTSGLSTSACPSVRAGAGDEVEHAIGEAGIAQAFGVQAHDPGGIGGRFDDHRVASHQGCAGRAAGQREGEVERGNDQPHAVRLQD